MTALEPAEKTVVVPPKTAPTNCCMKQRVHFFLGKNATQDAVGERGKGASEVSQQAESVDRSNGVAPCLILKPLATPKDVSHDVAPNEGQKQIARSRKLCRMNGGDVLNKKVALGILLSIIGSVCITYSILTVVYEFGGTGTLAGKESECEYNIVKAQFPSVGVQVRYNIDETPGDLVTTIDFGTVYDEAYSSLLLICGDVCEKKEVISLTNNLDPAVGTCIWEIEYDNDIGSPDDWVWIEYDPENHPEQRGSSEHPLGDEYIGLKQIHYPWMGTGGYFRYLRVKFIANPDAEMAPFSFTMTVTGTEYVPP